MDKGFPKGTLWNLSKEGITARETSGPETDWHLKEGKGRVQKVWN